MSKMSELHRELSEQASELGFESIEQAEANGYTIDYTESRLVKHGCCEMARAYASRREEILDKLDGVIEYLKGDSDKDVAGYMIRELEDVENYVRGEV